MGVSFAIAWLVLAIVIGSLATNKGRSAFGWFLLALVISPLIAGILLALVKDRLAEKDRPNSFTHVRCSDCKEWVLREAVKCKHCGSALVPQPYAEDKAQSSQLADGLIDGGPIIVFILVAIGVVIYLIVN